MAREKGEGSYSRRKLLTGLGTVGAAALAGCGSTTDTNVGKPSDKEVPPPSVDTGKQWKLSTPGSQPRLIKKGKKVIDYQAVGHTQQYENSQLRNRIKEETFGEIDRPFSVGFASRIDIFPSYASAGTILMNEDIKNQLIAELKSAMSDFGVQNIREEESITKPNTKATTWHVIKGEFPVEAVTVEGLNIPHSDKEQLQFGGGSIDIKGVIGRWKQDGSILAAGGVYPNQPYRDDKEIKMSDAINLSISIDLGINPSALESDLFEFADSVSL